jgi:hypothetical protein
MSPAAVVVVCALELLGRAAETFPPIRIIADRPPTASRNAEAFVTRADRTINLIASSPALAAAARTAASVPRCRDHAALALVASIIIHEEWHLLHGADEGAAYEAQLTTLQALGYRSDSAAYQRVLRAMLAVTR